jgi:Cdc6-like AAA superfamily ATPase
MNEQNVNNKRGRPAKYATPEDKARADVDRRRELRRKEAHERRERLHAQFYGVEYAPPADSKRESGFEIIIENPGGSKKTECFDEGPPADTPKTLKHNGIEGRDDEHKPQTGHSAASLEPELCGEQLRVADLVAWGDNVFYTGGAGTGKSTVLRAIVKELREQGRRVQVVTPTGISALNVGGSTYFTWAGWNPSVAKKSIKEIRALT